MARPTTKGFLCMLYITSILIKAAQEHGNLDTSFLLWNLIPNVLPSLAEPFKSTRHPVRPVAVDQNVAPHAPDNITKYLWGTIYTNMVP